MGPHDLRQPLNALNLFFAQLRNKTDPSEQTRIATRIEAALESMNEQFDALLDISKLDAGVIAAKPKPFPIATLLDRIEATFSTAAHAKGLQLRVERSASWVKSDPILLERIIANLVSNAIHYTRSGSVTVECHSVNECLRIDVQDTGVGIPQDQVQHIFAEFYRGAGPTRLGEAGFGLGLSIVDRLARLLSHPVEVQSATGAGSRFSIHVPSCAPAPQAAATPASTRENADIGTGHRALVVDDDPLALDSMVGLLEDWGFEVVDASTSNAAMEYASQSMPRIDLIVSDYRLGDDTTGIGLISNLRRAMAREVPALLVSGDRSLEVAAAARAAGLEMLAKPVVAMTLRAVVTAGLAPRSEAVEAQREPAVPII